MFAATRILSAEATAADAQAAKERALREQALSDQAAREAAERAAREAADKAANDEADGAKKEAAAKAAAIMLELKIADINFDYDKYNLKPEAQEILKKGAPAYLKYRDYKLVVEGHCDERGTVDYNLALGQKRAKSVRDYYVRLGVPEGVMGTISYGEEKPLCTESTEACWAQNRRAETKIKGN